MYCDPPSSLARKAALTAIDMMCDAILKWLAPVLSFTCEEAWRTYKPDAEPSVHLTLFPQGLDGFRDDALAAKWETIRNVRRVVTGALEVETRRQADRLVAGSLGRWSMSPTGRFSPLCSMSIWPRSGITSNAMITNDDAPADAFRLNDVPGVAVVVEKSRGHQMARGRGKSCRPWAKTPNIPTCRRATRRRCASGKRWAFPFSLSSSRRRPGPITTCFRDRSRKMTGHLSKQNQHGVWVPAFAGTTWCVVSTMAP